MLLARFDTDNAVLLRMPGIFEKRVPRGHPAYAQIAERVARTAQLIEGRESPDMIPLHEAPQPDDYSCWDVLAKAIGKLRGVGPQTLQEWKELLGSNRAHATFPDMFAEVMASLGLEVTAKEGMTVEELRDEWQNGYPVVCPVQEYGPETKAQP